MFLDMKRSARLHVAITGLQTRNWTWVLLAFVLWFFDRSRRRSFRYSCVFSWSVRWGHFCCRTPTDTQCICTSRIKEVNQFHGLLKNSLSAWRTDDFPKRNTLRWTSAFKFANPLSNTCIDRWVFLDRLQRDNSYVNWVSTPWTLRPRFWFKPNQLKSNKDQKRFFASKRVKFRNWMRS